MQETFGCVVENRFNQLLDDESDPFDLIRQAAVEKNRQKKEELGGKKGKKPSQKDRKTILAPAKAPAPVVQQTGQKNAPQLNEKRGKFRSLGSEFNTNTDKGRTNFKEFRSNTWDNDMEFNTEKPFDRERDIRNWLAGKVATNKATGGSVRNGENQRGKREFERHSGSDKTRIKAEDKRGGSGPHNWGSIKDDFSHIEQLPSEEQNNVYEAPYAEEEPAKMDEDIFEAVQEMTLDEWKLIRDQNKPKPEFKLRKTESSVPSKAVVIHKSKYKDLEEDAEDYQYCIRKPVNDITSQLDINFGSLSRPVRGARGGRGRVRREETLTHADFQVHSTAPDPYDPEDFPALI